MPSSWQSWLLPTGRLSTRIRRVAAIMEVVTTNLGRSWGLLVASALLVDYILTVAVSISSGASYITTAVPSLLGHEVPCGCSRHHFGDRLNLPRYPVEAGRRLCCAHVRVHVFYRSHGCRQLREDGDGPSGYCPHGCLRSRGGPRTCRWLGRTGGCLLLMRAFSSGCAALTGVEAISNGVPMFRRPNRAMPRQPWRCWA